MQDGQQNGKRKGKFLLQDGYLYVANTGRPFSREGAAALEQLYLSEKDTDENLKPDDPLKDEAITDCEEWNKVYVNEYKCERLRLLKKDNDRKAKINKEKELKKSYKDRWLLELLQNMNDANCHDSSPKDMIGTKGLGFVSILEVAKDPDIFSGKLKFGFNKKNQTDPER